MPTRSSEADQKTALRKRLLNVVLHSTIRSTGVPAEWIVGGTNVMKSPAGEVTIELALEVTCDEPRFLTYLSAIQAEFVQTLLTFEESAFEWFSGIQWRLSTEPVLDRRMPSPEYWNEVRRDRAVTARREGLLAWDRHALSKHFLETEPAALTEGVLLTHIARAEDALLA